MLPFGEAIAAVQQQSRAVDELRRFWILAWLVAACAQAQAPAGFVDPMPDFPAGSIGSVERADAALAAAAGARIRQQKRAEIQRQACYKKFFAENCLSTVRDADYLATRRISALEQESRDFKRRNDAAIQAKRRADKIAKEQADAERDRAERESKRISETTKIERNQREGADFDAKAGERAQRAAATAKREQDHQAERARKDAEELAKAPEREEQARAHDAKVEEVLKRAQEREAKQREKEKQRQLKAASQPPKS
jgi:hypothetical protein